MVEFTMLDYWRYRYLFPMTYTLNDVKEEYKIEKTHQYHDKVFKEILDNKKEFINFMTKYTEFETAKLRETKIEKYNRKFITSSFLTKEADIIYKVKGKNVFILIEHQSTIDYKMAERIQEYCMELMRSIRKENNTVDKLYPLICPIVFYTGRKKWDAPLTISDVQEKYEGFKPLDYPRYNLIDINNYEKEELLKEDTAIAKAMLFEKIETKEEILKYKEILNKKGGINMTNFERLLIELIDEKAEKYRAEREAGQKIGQKNEIQKVINNMLKMNMNDKVIIEATQVNPKELQRIKKELKVC